MSGRKTNKAVDADILNLLLDDESLKTSQINSAVDALDTSEPSEKIETDESKKQLDLNSTKAFVHPEKNNELVLDAILARVSNQNEKNVKIDRQKSESLDEIREQVAKAVKEKNSGKALVAEQEMVLNRSEQQRLSQDRIIELETLVEKLLVENERLAATADTFRNRVDELMSKNDKLDRDLKEKLEIHREDKSMNESIIKSRNKEVTELKLKIDELNMRLQADLKRIRAREKELENRLEIGRIEGIALLRSKDEMILELKRRMDQMLFEIDNYKARGKEMHQKIEANQERLRRTVRALRIALSHLEGEDGDVVSLKKVE
jgi:hypothetical protein